MKFENFESKVSHTSERLESSSERFTQLKKDEETKKIDLLEKLRNTPRVLKRMLNTMMLSTMIAGAMAIPKEASAMGKDGKSQKEIPYMTKDAERLSVQLKEIENENLDLEGYHTLFESRRTAKIAEDEVEQSKECGKWSKEDIAGDLVVRTRWGKLVQTNEFNGTQVSQAQIIDRLVVLQGKHEGGGELRSVKGVGVTEEAAIESALHEITQGASAEVASELVTKRDEVNTSVDSTHIAGDAVLSGTQVKIKKTNQGFEATIQARISHL